MAEIAKPFGEGRYTIPAALAAAAVAYIDDTSPIAEWGQRCARGYLTGVPAMLLMQRVLGASRPGESDQGSRWRPFQDDKGVSGHAFMGAVPFLTLADMVEDNNWLKYAAYAASVLPAWSRVNDDVHYFSQAALGWYMAWETVRAVNDTEKKSRRNLAVVPFVSPDGVGISLFARW